MKTAIGLFVIVLGITLLGRCAPRDDTDPPGERSGMSLYIDHRTGCQYLGIPFGGITPRVDGAGRHVGCKS